MLIYKNNLVVNYRVEVLGNKYHFITFINVDNFNTLVVVTKDDETIFRAKDLDDFHSIFINKLKQEWIEVSRISPSHEKYLGYKQLQDDTYNHYIYSFAALLDLGKQKGKTEEELRRKYRYDYERFDKYIGK